MSKDGMDCILCAFDIKSKKLKYAGANNFFYLLRNNEIIVSQTDKMPVGLTHKERPFTLHEIDLKENDQLYLVTDGFADQFGGPKGKKFKYKQLQQLILSNGSLSMPEQKELLNNEIENWRGNLEQVDDICLVGIKI